MSGNVRKYYFKLDIISVVILIFLFAPKIQASCTSPAGEAGHFRWSTSAGEMQYCNGTTWNSLKYGGIAVSSTLTDVSTQVSSPKGVAISGNYAYVVDSTEQKLFVIDITTLSNPSIVGSISNSLFGGANGANEVTVSGTYAYVAGGSSVIIVNITTPTAPTLAGSVTNGTELPNVQGITVSGNYAYVACNQKLTVVDVTNKASPSVAGSVTNTSLNWSQGVVVSGTYAYVTSSNYLTIVNVATPTAPVVSSSLNDSRLASARGVDMSGNYVYVAATAGNTYGSLDVVDVTSKTAPVYLADLSDGVGKFEEIEDVVIVGTYAYVVQQNGRNTENYLSKVNISTPSSPTLVSATAIPGPMAGHGCNYLAANASKAVCIDTVNKNILTFNTSVTPATSSATLAAGGKFDSGDGIAVSGSYAFVTSPSSSRLTAVNISNLNSPTITSSLYHVDLKDARGISVVGNYAYIATSGSSYNIVIVDISNPAAMSRVGVYSNFAWVQLSEDIKTVGNYTYFTSSSNDRFSVINVTTPSNPVAVSSVTAASLDQAKGFDISGSYAYVCGAGAQTLNVVNISVPASINIAATLVNASLSGCKAVAVLGSYAYVVATSSNSLVIVDITTPTSPAIVGTLVDSGAFAAGTDIKVSGNYAYVSSSSNSRLTMIDVTVKTNPQISDYLIDTNSMNGLNSIFVSGTAVLGIASTSELFGVFNVTPPNNLGACTQAGQFSYNTVQKVAAFCNGANNYSMGPIPGTGGSACTAPTAPVGSLQYFSGTNRFKYCDGANWVNAGK